MCGTAIAVGVNLAASAISGRSARKAANKAADAQVAAADKASETQLEMYYQSREDVAPWRETGMQALNVQRQLLGLKPLTATVTDYDEQGNPIDSTKNFDAIDPQNYLKNLPGYEFAKNEGLKSIERQLGPAGSSGATQKAIGRYVTGLADQSFNTRLNQLSTLSSGGQRISSNMGAQSLNTGTNLAQIDQGVGTINAARHINDGNIKANQYNEIAKLFGNTDFSNMFPSEGDGANNAYYDPTPFTMGGF